MSQTLLDLNEQDQRWLTEQAKAEHLPMAEIVSRVIQYYRDHARQEAKTDFDGLLENTRGIWRHGDGLAFQQRLRGEWDER